MSKQNKTIKFLYEASKLLPHNEFYTAIRSRMLTKCSGINSTNSLVLDLVPRCDACGIVFKDIPPVNIIKPVKKPSCYRKIKNGTKNNTKYQSLCLKKFKKYKNDKQILISQCNLCKKQIKHTIKKIGHTRSKLNRVNSLNDSNKKKKLKKSQRKKNREFSGLNKSAVLSAKRSLEIEDNNNLSPKKPRTEPSVINLVTPEGKKTKNDGFSTPETINLTTLNILTPNTINKNVKYTSTPYSDGSDVICLDSPKKTVKEIRNLNDMFTPIFNKTKTVIEISDSDAQSCNSSTKKKKKKKNKKNKIEVVQKVEPKPKMKKSNNVILVADQSAEDKKKKKLNSLSNFLKNASNIQKPNQNNTLQNFLSNFI